MLVPGEGSAGGKKLFASTMVEAASAGGSPNFISLDHR